MPKETERLLKVVEIKYMANNLGIETIEEANSKIKFNFRNNVKLDMEKLSEAVKYFRGRILFSAGDKSYITLSFDEEEDELLKNIKFLLQSIN